MISFKPTSDNIIVEIEKVEKTTSGLYVPPTVQERYKPIGGTVVAIGPGRLNPDGARTVIEAKVGDKVAFPQYAGTSITIDDKEYWVMSYEQDVLGIF